MKLPFGKKARIPKEKITGYIPSETHSKGKIKAKFFRHYGFDESNVTLLEKSLIKIASTQETSNIVESDHGTKYVIKGKIKTPSGKIIQVRTIWIIEPNQEVPRFVTAYPV